MNPAVLVGALLAAAAGAAEEVEGGLQSADAGTPPAMEVEAFEPAPAAAVNEPAMSSFDPVSSGLTARVFGDADLVTGVDTVFDSPKGVDLAENVVELRARARLGVDVKVNDWLRVYLEGRAQVRAAAQRDFDRAKGSFEPMLGDAFVDLYTRKVDVRIGNQRVNLGANPGLAPADALNPRDLRESFAMGDIEYGTLPVFAIRAMGEVGRVGWMAAYAPFFTPHRYVVFGQDEALLQPGAGSSLPTNRVDPSIEDYIQDRILETKRPPPGAGDVAVRAVTTGDLKVGGSWVWMNEKIPQVRIDSELNALLKSQQSGEPVDQALLASVSSRLQAGQTLYSGTYQRQHLFSLEGSRLIGPGQLDVDFTYCPQQTFFDPSFAPLRKSAVTWVVSYTQASDSPWFYAVSYLGMAIPSVAANEQLFLIEPATAVGADRTAWLHIFAGTLSRKVWKDRFELSMRAIFEPVQLSYALAPRVSFTGVDRLKLWVAAEFYQGSQYSPLGYFGRNDKVLLGAHVDLF